MKYYFNEATKTLHKVKGCYHSKFPPTTGKCYRTEDEAIRENTKYFKRCKLCFKETVQ